jgi:3D (Asp-Asp-Asp) domain-containing protein
MRARIIAFAALTALGISGMIWQAPPASAQSAQFFVTGYVLTGLTATGTYTHPGTCAVDPRVIPLGSYFTISGIGLCHAEDTGGAILGYRVDVWVPTVAQAYAITGWRTVTWGVVPGVAATQPQLPVHAQPAARPASAPAPSVSLWYWRPDLYRHVESDIAPEIRAGYDHGDSRVHRIAG